MTRREWLTLVLSLLGIKPAQPEMMYWQRGAPGEGWVDSSVYRMLARNKGRG